MGGVSYPSPNCKSLLGVVFGKVGDGTWTGTRNTSKKKLKKNTNGQRVCGGNIEERKIF